MMMIIIISVIVICIPEGIILVRKKLGKELITAGLITLIAIFLEISKSYGLITPMNLIGKILQPVGRLYLKQL